MHLVRLFIICLLLTALVAMAGTSANYTLAPDTVDSGGLTGSSASYTINGSTTPGGPGSSSSYTLSTGFAGQLFESTTSGNPEIAVEQPPGTNLNTGGSRSFGNVTVGAHTLLTFTVRNTGNAYLTGLGVTIGGSDASQFTVAAVPAATAAPSGSTTFTVRFTPLSAGAKTAALQLTSNDADENPFVINLAGTGRTLVEDMNFTSFRFTGIAGRDVELKFSTQSGATYRLLTSPSMLPGSWMDTGVNIAGTGAEQIIILPNAGLSTRQFFRIVKL